MELQVRIKNGDTVKAITRDVLRIDPIVERANYGFEAVSFEIPTKDIALDSDGFVDLKISYLVDIYFADKNQSTQIYGGIIYDYEIRSDGITTIFLESHAHGLELLNFRNTLDREFTSGSVDELSVIYVNNNGNILKLKPNPPQTETEVLGSGIAPDQTQRKALLDYCYILGKYYTIRPDGTLIAESYADEKTAGLTILPSQKILSAVAKEDYEGIINRDQRFLRALKDGSQDTNGQQTIVTTGTTILGDFVPSEDYDIAGVAFLISAPKNETFTLELFNVDTSSVEFSTTTNLAEAKDHELAIIPIFKSITNIIKSSGNPLQITAPSHGFSTGNRVQFDTIGGTIELNESGKYQITVLDSNNFTLDGTDSDDFSDYTGGGRTWRDSKFYRYVMFDRLVPVKAGVDYSWIGLYPTTTGGAPNQKFGNIFDFGSHTKDSSFTYTAGALEQQNKSIRTVRFDVPLDFDSVNPAGSLRIGKYTQLSNMQNKNLEVADHIVERRIDWDAGIVTITMGAIFETIAEKIARLGTRNVR
jgi:hypothetical protein